MLRGHGGLSSVPTGVIDYDYFTGGYADGNQGFRMANPDGILSLVFHEAVPTDTLEPLSPSDAARCIAGMLLAVPRGIVQGMVTGSAVAHAEGVTVGCSRLLGLQ